MKYNNIIISTIIIIVILTIYSCSHGCNRPEIDIKKISKNDAKNNHLFTYKIKIRANDNLKYFVILPSVKGINHDSKMVHSFNEKTRYAELDYFYLLPDNIADSKGVKLKLQVKTENGSSRKLEVILL